MRSDGADFRRPYATARKVRSRDAVGCHHQLDDGISEECGEARKPVEFGQQVEIDLTLEPQSGSWRRITSACQGVGSTFGCKVRRPVGVVAGRVGAL